MQRDYLIAIGLYIVATVITGLPFLGIVQFSLPLSYETLELLHLLFVFVVLCVLIGQMIAINVMQHAGITTQAAVEYLSLLDHTIPVSLVAIGVSATRWRRNSGRSGRRRGSTRRPSCSSPTRSAASSRRSGSVAPLSISVRRPGALSPSTSAAGSVSRSSSIITAVMVYKRVPIPTAHHFVDVTRYFAGAL